MDPLFSFEKILWNLQTTPSGNSKRSILTEQAAQDLYAIAPTLSTQYKDLVDADSECSDATAYLVLDALVKEWNYRAAPGEQAFTIEPLTYNVLANTSDDTLDARLDRIFARNFAQNQSLILPRFFVTLVVQNHHWYGIVFDWKRYRVYQTDGYNTASISHAVLYARWIHRYLQTNTDMSEKLILQGSPTPINVTSRYNSTQYSQTCLQCAAINVFACLQKADGIIELTHKFAPESFYWMQLAQLIQEYLVPGSTTNYNLGEQNGATETDRSSTILLDGLDGMDNISPMNLLANDPQFMENMQEFFENLQNSEENTLENLSPVLLSTGIDFCQHIATAEEVILIAALEKLDESDSHLSSADLRQFTHRMDIDEPRRKEIMQKIASVRSPRAKTTPIAKRVNPPGNGLRLTAHGEKLARSIACPDLIGDYSELTETELALNILDRDADVAVTRSYLLQKIAEVHGKKSGTRTKKFLWLDKLVQKRRIYVYSGKVGSPNNIDPYIWSARHGVKPIVTLFGLQGIPIQINEERLLRDLKTAFCQTLDPYARLENPEAPVTTTEFQYICDDVSAVFNLEKGKMYAKSCLPKSLVLSLELKKMTQEESVRYSDYEIAKETVVIEDNLLLLRTPQFGGGKNSTNFLPYISHKAADAANVTCRLASEQSSKPDYVRVEVVTTKLVNIGEALSRDYGSTYLTTLLELVMQQSPEVKAITDSVLNYGSDTLALTSS